MTKKTMHDHETKEGIVLYDTPRRLNEDDNARTQYRKWEGKCKIMIREEEGNYAWLKQEEAEAYAR